MPYPRHPESRKEHPAPPRLARRILLLLTPPGRRAELDGDLQEGYARRRRAWGTRRALLWYWRHLLSADVFRLRRLHRRVRPSSPAISDRLHEQVWQDVRYSLRIFRNRPLFSLTVLATLAIAIGGGTAIFSVVNGVMLRPLPYKHSERLAMVFRTVPRLGFTRSTVSYPDFADWREQSSTFESMAAYAPSNLTYQGGQGAEKWQGYRVTADLWELLGIAPSVGRVFDRAEDRPGAPPTIVLSHGIWLSRFGGDPDLPGRSIVLDRKPVTVTGVMPSDFSFPALEADYWEPLRGDRARMERDSNFLAVLGRLKKGISIDAAQEEMESLSAAVEALPGSNRGLGVFVELRHSFVVRNARTALLVFMGVVMLALLVACANVANLMLCRAMARGREWAVRIALGAGRSRLVRQMLTESAVLAVAGGAVGLAVAAGLLKALVSMGANQFPRLDEVSIDPAVLAFSLLISVASGLLFGAAPAFFAGGDHIEARLKNAARSTPGRVGSRLREAFVAAQVALAIVLLIGSGLLVNSFFKLTSVELGFDPTQVLTARVGLPEFEAEPGMSEEQRIAAFVVESRRRRQFFDQLRQQLSVLPGMQEVGLAYTLPFSVHGFSREIVPEAGEFPAKRASEVSGNVIEGAYFSALRIRLLRGRSFTPADAGDSPPVTILNETAANLFWPGQDAVGKRVRIGGGERPWTTVVGVVADVRQRSLTEGSQPMYYRPFAQASWADALFIVARTGAPAADLVALVREQVWALNPRLALTDVALASDLVDRAIAGPRFRTLVFSAFGGFAVFLAIVGLYGIVALATGERTREIGLRIALGADRPRIIRMVLSRALAMTAAGTLAGVAGALALTRFLSSMLFGVTPYDAPTYAAAVMALVAIAALASFLPANRASRIDPADSLRYE